MAKVYIVRYVYDNPSGAGPFKGKAEVVCHNDTKPAKGESFYGPFGMATIVSASLKRGQS